MANVAAMGQVQNMMLDQLKKIQQQQQQQIQEQQIHIEHHPTNQINPNTNNPDFNKEPGNGMLSLLFKRSNPENNIDFQITIICSPKDKIGSAIDKYLTKSLENKKDVVFLFNATELGNISHKTIESVGLINLSKIMVVNKKNALAGYQINN